MISENWLDQFQELSENYSEAIKSFTPANEKQMLKIEQVVGKTIWETSPSWRNFLQRTNGATLLDYCILGARNSQIASIDEVNRELWEIEAYKWSKDNFISFLGDSTGMTIGFALRNSEVLCIAFMSEPSDNAILPIASSFESFLSMFIEDVSMTLKSWDEDRSEMMPLGISNTWPLDLGRFCDRDPELKSLLRQGALLDLYKSEEYYLGLVKTMLGN